MTADEPAQLAQQLDELQGSMLATECFLNALAQALSPDARQVVRALHATESAAFRTALRNSPAPQATVDAFERDVRRAEAILGQAAE